MPSISSPSLGRSGHEPRRTRAQLRDEATRQAAALVELAVERGGTDTTFTAFEVALGDAIFALARTVLVLFLVVAEERVSAGLTDEMVRDGRVFRRDRSLPRSLMSRFGIVRYWRTYMHSTAPGSARRHGFHLALHFGVERLDEHEATPHPALVPAEQARDLGLRDVVLAVERAHEPRLFELREPTSVVKLAQPELRVDRADRDDASTERRPAERARGAQSLEAVDDLEPLCRREEHERRQLPVLLERAAHRRERLAVAEAQHGEALAERVDLDQLRVGDGLGHACTSSTPLPTRTRVMRDGPPALRRNHQPAPALASGGSCVTGAGGSPDFRENPANFRRRSCTRVARDSANAFATIPLISSCESGHLGAEGGA